MGGAVALLLHRKQPDFWDGAVLVAPMCKVIVFNNMYFFFYILKEDYINYIIFSYKPFILV